MLNIKKIKPLHNMLVTTMEKYSEEEAKVGGIIDSSKIKNPIKEYQKVVEIGPMVRNIQVGDLVMINPARYTRKKYEENTIKKDIQGYDIVLGVDFPTITMDSEDYLLLYDSDIEYVISEYEEIEEEEKEDPNAPRIIIPNKQILL